VAVIALYWQVVQVIGSIGGASLLGQRPVSRPVVAVRSLKGDRGAPGF
jgi:hypothetical protein